MSGKQTTGAPISSYVELIDSGQEANWPKQPPMEGPYEDGLEAPVNALASAPFWFILALLVLHHSAVDVQGLPCNISRSIGCEK